MLYIVEYLRLCHCTVDAETIVETFHTEDSKFVCYKAAHYISKIYQFQLFVLLECNLMKSKKMCIDHFISVKCSVCSSNVSTRNQFTFEVFVYLSWMKNIHFNSIERERENRIWSSLALLNNKRLFILIPFECFQRKIEPKTLVCYASYDWPDWKFHLYKLCCYFF